MTREGEAQLIEFCLAQEAAFDKFEWLRFDSAAKDELAAAARCMAGRSDVDAGTRIRFLHIAKELVPDISTVAGLVKQSRFDLARFSNLIGRAHRHALAAS